MLGNKFSDMPDAVVINILSRLEARDLHEVAQTSLRHRKNAQHAYRALIANHFPDAAINLEWCELEEYKLYYAALVLKKNISVLNNADFKKYFKEVYGGLSANDRNKRNFTEFSLLLPWSTQVFANRQEFSAWLGEYAVNIAKYNNFIKEIALQKIMTVYDADTPAEYETAKHYLNPLTLAIDADALELVQDLINFNADVNIKYPTDKWSPKTLLARSTARITKALLSAGADANMQDRYGRAALYQLITRDITNIEKAKELLRAGADVKLKDPNGVSAHDIACSPTTMDTEVTILIKRAHQFQIEYFAQKLMTGSVADVKDIINKQQAAGITKAQMRDHILQAGGTDDTKQKRILARALERDENGNPANALALYMDIYQVMQDSGTATSYTKWLAKSASDYAYTPGSFFFRRDTETVQIIQQHLNELQSKMDRAVSPSPNDMPLIVRQYSLPGGGSASSSSNSSSTVRVKPQLAQLHQ